MYLSAARLLIDAGLEVCAHHSPPLSERVAQVLRELERECNAARQAWAQAHEPRPPREIDQVEQLLDRYRAAAAAGLLGDSILNR